eukprot:scaffold1307_cov200-Pinguiococcus_pyrenoidosus.AAC.33
MRDIQLFIKGKLLAEDGLAATRLSVLVGRLRTHQADARPAKELRVREDARVVDVGDAQAVHDAVCNIIHDALHGAHPSVRSCIVLCVEAPQEAILAHHLELLRVVCDRLALDNIANLVRNGGPVTLGSPLKLLSTAAAHLDVILLLSEEIVAVLSLEPVESAEGQHDEAALVLIIVVLLHLAQVARENHAHVHLLHIRWPVARETHKASA